LRKPAEIVTFPSLKPDQFGGIAHVPGFQSEWQENMRVLLHPKAKITKFGDKQASRIGVRTKYFFVRCTRTTNLEAWRTPAEMFGSPKGSLKFLFRQPTLRSGRPS